LRRTAANIIEDGYRARGEAVAYGRSGHPVVLKQISRCFSARTTRRLIDYIARLDRPPDMPHREWLAAEAFARDLEAALPYEASGTAPRPRLFDEYGREVQPESLEAALADWNMAADRDNLSPRGRAALVEGGWEGVKALPEDQRYGKIQTHHLVMSVPVSPDQARLVELATSSAIERTFLAMGHKVLWALHTDKEGAPHVHLAVRARSDDTGKQLRFDKDGAFVDGLRANLAEAASEIGIRATAERIEDRNDAIEILREGDLLDRDSRSFRRMPADRGGRVVEIAGVRSELDLLEDRAPRWARYFGPAYAASEMEQAVDNAGPSSTPFRLLTLVERNAAASLFVSGAAQDAASAGHAVIRYAALAAENHGFALWVLAHRPQVLGLKAGEDASALEGLVPDHANRAPEGSDLAWREFKAALEIERAARAWKRQVSHIATGSDKLARRLSAIEGYEDIAAAVRQRAWDAARLRKDGPPQRRSEPEEIEARQPNRRKRRRSAGMDR